jgi:hypothetical protein
MHMMLLPFLLSLLSIVIILTMVIIPFLFFSKCIILPDQSLLYDRVVGIKVLSVS